MTIINLSTHPWPFEKLLEKRLKMCVCFVGWAADDILFQAQSSDDLGTQIFILALLKHSRAPRDRKFWRVSGRVANATGAGFDHVGV